VSTIIASNYSKLSISLSFKTTFTSTSYALIILLLMCWPYYYWYTISKISFLSSFLRGFVYSSLFLRFKWFLRFCITPYCVLNIRCYKSSKGIIIGSFYSLIWIIAEWSVISILSFYPNLRYYSSTSFCLAYINSYCLSSVYSLSSADPSFLSFVYSLSSADSSFLSFVYSYFLSSTNYYFLSSINSYFLSFVNSYCLSSINSHCLSFADNYFLSSVYSSFLSSINSYCLSSVYYSSPCNNSWLCALSFSAFYF